MGEISARAISDALDQFVQSPLTAHAAAGRLLTHVHAEHDVDTNAGRLLGLYRSSGM